MTRFDNLAAIALTLLASATMVLGAVGPAQAVGMHAPAAVRTTA